MLARFSGAISKAYQVARRQLERRPWLLLVLFVASAFTIFALYSTERYLAFQTNYFDLGLYANSVWRTIHGYGSWSTLILPSKLGNIDHISPILGLVALAYALVPDPRTLLVIQAGAIAFAAVPLYLTALRETRNQFLSVTIAGLFLANPAVHGIIRFDFHTESFIPLFVYLMYFSHPRESLPRRDAFDNRVLCRSRRRNRPFSMVCKEAPGSTDSRHDDWVSHPARNNCDNYNRRSVCVVGLAGKLAGGTIPWLQPLVLEQPRNLSSVSRKWYSSESNIPLGSHRSDVVLTPEVFVENNPGSALGGSGNCQLKILILEREFPVLRLPSAVRLPGSNTLPVRNCEA